MLNCRVQRGAVQLLLVTLLASVSFSLIGYTLQKSHKQVEGFTRQAASQDMQLKVKYFIWQSIYDYLATTELTQTTQQIGNYTLRISVEENSALLNGVSQQFVTLKVTATDITRPHHSYSEQLVIYPRNRLIKLPPDKWIMASGKPFAEILSEFFHLDNTGIESLYHSANLTPESCSALGSHSAGLIWVKTDCLLSDMSLGSPARPIILLVENGHLELNNANVHGIVIHLCQNNKAYTAKLSVGSRLSGAAFSSCSTAIGLNQVVYNKDLLNTLLKHGDNRYSSIVEGSWYYD